jgi:2-C-methyl-D-erythritol 2,4-cyclodiphosphate synthase
VRVGLGYDAHRLVAGRPLVIGGVELDSELGLLGHSDADVLSHAIVDALLGAAGLGTIGELFPDDDPRFKGISSLELVGAAAARLREAGFHVVNVDTVVVAERPRLQPHLAEMARRLAGRLGLDTPLVSVKATSPEGLGALGRMEGIAAQAVALIDRR